MFWKSEFFTHFSCHFVRQRKSFYLHLKVRKHIRINCSPHEDSRYFKLVFVFIPFIVITSWSSLVYFYISFKLHMPESSSTAPHKSSTVSQCCLVYNLKLLLSDHATMIQLHFDPVTESANHWAHISLPCPKRQSPILIYGMELRLVEIYFVGRTLVAILSLVPLRKQWNSFDLDIVWGFWLHLLWRLPKPSNCYLQISQFSWYILEYIWILVAWGRILSFLRTVQSCIRH